MNSIEKRKMSENNTINLKDYKNRKKSEKIVSDINHILKIFGLAQKSLSYFKQYTPVLEIISILETNKTFLELHRKKHKDMLK